MFKYIKKLDVVKFVCQIAKTMKSPSSPDDSSTASRPVGQPRRTWTRSGREEFVQAAVAYLDGADGHSVSDPPDAPRASDRGAADLGIRLVATLVGKSPSAPLFHFPDRLTLLAAVAAEGFRRVAEAVRKATDSTANADRTPVRIVVDAALAYIEWAGDHPALFAVMYTPALAPGIDAIQSGDDDFWQSPDATMDSLPLAATSVKAPEGRRRLAFQELHDAKIATVMAFMAAVGHVPPDAQFTQDATPADLLSAVIAMADGLAWQRVNERQQTPEMMRWYAERTLAFLVRGIG